jgi:exopolysaccharide production protein ExoZ
LLHSIHGLRFLAATLVVFHHSGLLVEPFNVYLGAAGVDMFFVISGVVIGASTKPDMSIPDFLMRRFFRVYPLYWLATIPALILLVKYVRPVTPTDIIHSALLIPPELSSNWFPIYFPAWSLTFEIMFYAIFALCLVTGRYARPVCGVILTALAFMLSDPASPSYLRIDAMLLFEFIAGLLISFATERNVLPGKALGAVLIGLAAAGFAWHATPGSSRLLAWGIPAILTVYGMLAFERASFLRHPLIVLGGHASYAIFLFHVSLIEFTRTLFSMNGLNAKQDIFLFAALTIPASIIVGMLVYVALDRPMLTWTGRLIPRRRIRQAA